VKNSAVEKLLPQGHGGTQRKTKEKWENFFDRIEKLIHRIFSLMPLVGFGLANPQRLRVCCWFSFVFLRVLCGKSFCF
jgi:hypothetical protein